MAHPEPEDLPLLLRPDLIEEARRLAAHYRSPEGQAEIAAWVEKRRNDPAERELMDGWASVADNSDWAWNEAK
ncbi:hypothetical protein [Brevundimonas sp. R86498]|uniref:hypothetical protein n=1 Tax=Brevundimonas sp. R86498 TaxID=3093845 RepID=UPI0037CC5FA3